MPKVYTQKAGKDYPQHGIKKGETYYRWAFFRQRDQLSKTYPTRSQLTQDEGLAQAYGVFDGDTPIDASGVETAISSLQEAAEMIQEKLDSMPEGLQEGDTGQMLQARIDSIESSAQELEDLQSSFDEAEAWTVPEKPTQGEGESDEDFEARVAELLEGKPEDGVYSWDEEAWTWEIDNEYVTEAFGNADSIEEG